MLAEHDHLTDDTIPSLFKQARTSTSEHEAGYRSGQRLVRAITHEIRSPLTVILAYASVVLERRAKLTAAEVAELIRAIESSARLASVIIDDLETIVARAQVRYEPSVVNVRRFLSDITPELRALAPKRDLDVTFSDERLSVSVDALRLRQVFANLVKNAHRHSRPGGKIFIRSLCTGRDVSVSVEDEGPGVPSEELGRIFEPFYRGAAASEVKGSGLGLTICKIIVERQGGRITASRGDRGGLRVDVTFPATAESQGVGRPSPVPGRIVERTTDAAVLPYAVGQLPA